MPAALVILFSE